MLYALITYGVAWLFGLGCVNLNLLGTGGLIQSFTFAWIRPVSGSIWPTALMHAVHNSFIQSALDKMTVNTGSTVFFTTEFGLALAMMGIIVAVIFWHIGIPKDKGETNLDQLAGEAA